MCSVLLADVPSRRLAQADREMRSCSLSLPWLLVSLCSETFWVAGPLVGHLPQTIQAWVMGDWLQIKRQDRQGQILFCVTGGEPGRVREKKNRSTLDLQRVEKQQKFREK